MDYNDEELENKELEESLGSPLDELPNENEPVQDELASSDDKVETEGPIINPTALAKKGFLEFLKKNPWVLAVFLIGFILLFAILMYQLDFDFYGIGNPKPEYYTNEVLQKCDQIYFTWEDEDYTKKRLNEDENYQKITEASSIDLEEEDKDGLKRYKYEEYDYDTFISGVVWLDNYKAYDVDNEIVYQAMVVVARSYLVSTLPNNCVVLKEFDEQGKKFGEFQSLPEDEKTDNYNEISSALTQTQGMVIGRNKKIIPALYDTFSYTKKRMDGEEGKEKNYFYHMMNENEQGEQIIRADWVDDIEKERGAKITKKVNSFKKFESLSIYGSKYLLEQIDSGEQYDLYRILETYFGRDIEFYTIDYYFSSNYIAGCSDISMTRTTLSKEDFIALAQQYGNGRGGGAKILSDNAELIYDLASANGINPELVFLRADVEGYSPGSSKNNYWGLGCTNTGGYNACINYNSLSEGIMGFLQFVSKYSTLTELMGHYAYLGDYWYNPGGAGVGGCYYMTPIYGNNVPEHVRNACASGKICNSDGSGDCVATTDADKEAYLKYQSQSMLSARKRIFNLDAEVCITDFAIGEPGVGNCEIWKQGEAGWGNISLGSSSTNMSRSGCAVTSIAIAISCSGTTINNVASFNPGSLVNKLNQSGGFTESGGIYWANSAITFFAPNFHWKDSIFLSGTPEEKANKIKNSIGTNTSIILHFVSESHPRGHYVVLKSISNLVCTVYDPAGKEPDVNTYNIKDADQMIIYNF